MTEKKKWRIGGPLTPLVPPGKEKGDALPPESMKLRAQILAEDARRKAERQKKVPGAVSAGPPQKSPWGGQADELFDGGGFVSAWIPKEDLPPRMGEREPWSTPPLKDLILHAQGAIGELADYSHLEKDHEAAIDAAAKLIRIAIDMEIYCVSRMPKKDKAG